MRTVFEHARVVDALTEDVIVQCADRAGGSSDPVELLHATDALALVAGAAEQGRSLSAAELDAVEVGASPEELEWTACGPRRVPARSSAREQAATDGLQALDRTGLLARLIPEWADVRCRPQRDPYHRYTVDVHLLRAFDGGWPACWPSPTRAIPWRSWPPVRSRNATARSLGALLHDIGKNGEGGHVLVGDRCRGHDRSPGWVCEASTGELARFMVAEHLLLPDTATTAGPQRRRPDPRTSRRGSRRRNGSRRCTCSRRPTRSRPARRRGRRGARR